MNTQWRLDSKAPRLANAFRKATPEKQRRAALIATEMAALILGLEAGEVMAALTALRDGRCGDGALQERLSALAARLDDEYFRLDEEGDETKAPEALRLFSKARAASAPAFALSPDSGSFTKPSTKHCRPLMTNVK